MSANVFEPRRLRDTPEGPRSIDGRLGRQLRILSAHVPTQQLRRYSALPRRRRYLLMFIRVGAVAAVVLAVSGAATAMATYVARQVWPGSSSDDRRASRAATLREKPSKSHPQRASLPAESPKPPLQSGGSANAGLAIGAEVPAAPLGGSRSFAARLSVPPATESRPALVASPAPLAASMEPPRSPGPPVAAAPLPTLASSPEWRPPAPSSANGGPAAAPAGGASRELADAVAREAEVLRQALAALRRDHDARRSLSLLDDYDRRFGRGVLAQEADATRAQAWLRLGDNSRGLALLDRLPLGQPGHSGELQVLRGELRSLSGRCREALVDFDAVLRAPAGHAASEIARALFGRASCRARTGDAVGAEADRQRYLKEFPQGPAAGQLSSRP